jgi:hypothetical protein
MPLSELLNAKPCNIVDCFNNTEYFSHVELNKDYQNDKLSLIDDHLVNNIYDKPKDLVPLFDINNKAKPQSLLGNRVVNLSDHHLTKSQISVLERGITFAPTPGPADFAEIRHDVSEFCRRLLLKVHFYDEDNPNDQSFKNEIPRGLLKFKPPSKWKPKVNDPVVNAFVNNVQQSIPNVNLHARNTSNLTKEEKEAILELKQNPKIVIKKADKGSSIVVLNRSDYIKEAERQLSDNRFYEETPVDLTEEHNHIEHVLEDLRAQEIISENIFKCLSNKTPKTASLYLLPKIHKVKNPGELPPGRPIISANGCPTERISAFVDENIKGALPHIPSYIKDTTDFIRKIESIKIPKNSILVSFDVSSLYTNIPNDEGVRAAARSMLKHKPEYADIRTVIKLLKEVLTKNNFSFNGKDYLQVGGTAMGTKLAPSYANIFMGDLEENLLLNAEKEPYLWLRFIDDIFVIWTHGLDELLKFEKYINEFHPTIKFTMEHSTESLVFLDTKVKKGPSDENLIVELYTKPTDTHNYLLFTSSHPCHTKRGGPYGQFLRIRRNCTLDVDFDKHSQSIKEHYLKRGYPLKW